MRDENLAGNSEFSRHAAALRGDYGGMQPKTTRHVHAPNAFMKAYMRMCRRAISGLTMREKARIYSLFRVQEARWKGLGKAIQRTKSAYYAGKGEAVEFI